MLESNLKKIERDRAVFSLAFGAGAAFLGWTERSWHELVFFAALMIIGFILMEIRACLEAIRFMMAHDFARTHIKQD